MASLFIILPVHNRRKITSEFISCLKRQTFSDYHLVLVDDGSQDGTAEMVEATIQSVTVLKGTGNLWWAGSLQKGIEWLREQNVSGASNVLMINDDVRFGPEFLATGMALMEQQSDALILAKAKDPETGKINETGVAADLRHFRFHHPDHDSQINCLPTRGLFLHWTSISRLGDFHPCLLPHYWSDYEYTLRAERCGLVCRTSDKLLLVENPDTTGYRSIGHERPIIALRRLFSKKSVYNPLYTTIFALMTVRSLWIFPILAKIWIISGWRIFRILLSTLRHGIEESKT